MPDYRAQVIATLHQIAEGEPEVVLDEVEVLVRQDSSSQGFSADTTAKMTLLAEVGQIAARCELCDLCRSRSKVVFGVGNPSARLMVIGEAPGADEDRIGEPFVGRAGQLLTKIIVAMKMTREEVYIANILKCRPPGNRNPSPFESVSCKPYLLKQIEIISPEIIVALGLVAAVNLLELPPTTAVKDLRGRVLEYAGKPLIVTYHPAALLRNPALKPATWEDMKRVMRLLDGTEKWVGQESGKWRVES